MKSLKLINPLPPFINYSLIDNKEEYLADSSRNGKIIVKEVLELISRSKRVGLFEREDYTGEIIDTVPKLKRAVNKLIELEEFSFDTEFSDLRQRSEGYSIPAGCSFSNGFLNYYIPVGHFVNGEEGNIPLSVFRRQMKRLFERENYRLIGHNLKAEMHFLANIGVEVQTEDLYDTLIMYWSVNHEKFSMKGSNSLEDISKKFYGYEQFSFQDLRDTIPKEVQTLYGITAKSSRPINMVDKYIAGVYALDDTYWTWRIYLDLLDILEYEGADKIYSKVQRPYMKVLFNMERRGVHVDFERLEAMERDIKELQETLEYEIYELAGTVFDISSPQQKAELIFGWEKHKLEFATEKEYAIDSEGNRIQYKSGPRKGEDKYKEVYKLDRDGNKIPEGSIFTGNKDLLAVSFNFPMPKDNKKLKEHLKKGFPEGTFPQPSTGEDSLKGILGATYKSKRKQEGQELIRKILFYLKIGKIASTYLSGIKENNYLDKKTHGNFNQTGASSGRLSATSPNLQNLPRALEDISDEPTRDLFKTEEEFIVARNNWLDEKEEYDMWKQFEVRDIYVAGEGNLLTASDYSNLELRILAHFSQDELLLNMFKTGVDAHGDTAKNMFKLKCEANEVKKLYPHLRNRAKTINFLLVYGGSAKALSHSLGIPEPEAQELYDLYFATYKGVAQFMRRQKKVAKRQGYVQTVLGRKQYLPMIQSDNWSEKGYGERLAINSPVQGSGADIVISAQILIEKDELLKELGYKQILQVHDEIVGEVPGENVKQAIERVEYLMANCLPRELNGVKLEADSDYGRSYAEAK